jgi:hypothetical protein
VLSLGLPPASYTCRKSELFLFCIFQGEPKVPQTRFKSSFVNSWRHHHYPSPPIYKLVSYPLSTVKFVLASFSLKAKYGFSQKSLCFSKYDYKEAQKKLKLRKRRILDKLNNHYGTNNEDLWSLTRVFLWNRQNRKNHIEVTDYVWSQPYDQDTWKFLTENNLKDPADNPIEKNIRHISQDRFDSEKKFFIHKTLKIQQPKWPTANHVGMLNQNLSLLSRLEHTHKPRPENISLIW